MFETHQMLALALAVAGATAMVVGLVADIFGISTGIRNMLRRPAPPGLEPPPPSQTRRQGDGGPIAAGVAGGIVGGLVGGEIVRHGHDDAGDMSSLDAVSAPELDASDAGSAVSDLGDLGL